MVGDKYSVGGRGSSTVQIRTRELATGKILPADEQQAALAELVSYLQWIAKSTPSDGRVYRLRVAAGERTRRLLSREEAGDVVSKEMLALFEQRRKKAAGSVSAVAGDSKEKEKEKDVDEAARALADLTLKAGRENAAPSSAAASAHAAS